jgi:hypothetical protein
MLNITDKTKRAELITEIETLRTKASLDKEVREHFTKRLTEAENEIAHLTHRAEVAETDVHNLLGAIRVMADSSRVVRIRSKSIKPADMATALPSRNTDKI